MLRIYIHEDKPVTSFVLEGKLVGPWVKELERCWEIVFANNPAKPVLVDLADVTFIDLDGRALLRKMRRKGVKLLSHGVLIDALVAEIEAEETPEPV
jgi:anti-anti-sigma regulatory factor